jgi:hypothetical protein
LSEKQLPLLAEIADKMPTLQTMWAFWTMVGLAAGLITMVLTVMNMWVGAASVLISAGIGILAFSDRSLDSAIVSELGRESLVQNKMAPFVPFVFACIGWGVVAGKLRRKVKDSSELM